MFSSRKITASTKEYLVFVKPTIPKPNTISEFVPNYSSDIASPVYQSYNYYKQLNINVFGAG